MTYTVPREDDGNIILNPKWIKADNFKIRNIDQVGWYADSIFTKTANVYLQEDVVALNLDADDGWGQYGGEFKAGLALKKLYLFAGAGDFVKLEANANGGGTNLLQIQSLLGGIELNFGGAFTCTNLTVNWPAYASKLSIGNYQDAGEASLNLGQYYGLLPTTLIRWDIFLATGSMYLYYDQYRLLMTNMFCSTTNKTVANTVTETSLWTTWWGEQTIKAEFLQVWRSIELEATGTIANTWTPTIRIRFKIWSTTIVDTTAIVMVSLTGNNYWKAKAILTCRTTWFSGTVMGQGDFTYKNSTTPIMLSPDNTTTTTLVTHSNHIIDITAQWWTASASNTITCTNFTIKLI